MLNALVGSAGLAPTLAALQAGKTLALANKESLVVGGELVMDLVKGEPERLLPVESEHAALAMALRHERREDLKRVVLTGSGGPFRGWSRAELSRASVKEALQHPVWSMGPKITIDSATLMNKGLEVIEARWLFDMPLERVDVVVHPQSIVHSLVEFIDGSVLAQLGMPDMGIPILYALSYPERLPCPAPALDLCRVGTLGFEAPDPDAFRCLALARRAGQVGGGAPVVLNAANEVAVARFLDRQINYGSIPRLLSDVLEKHSAATPDALEVILDADAWARREAAAWRPRAIA